MKLSTLLHNLSHFILPLLLLELIGLKRGIDIYLIISIFLGSFLPDIDHLSIWATRRFKNFRSFLKYCFTSDRYRRAFLLFHNFPTIIALLISLPIASLMNFYLGVFILAMICHLFLDFLADSFALKTHSHWKVRKRI
ncbi:MAG: hypothetical protein DRP00_01935 [Candidatus Aenigmatarchaeota archaeon]|nr:MAG: hypothetical protein DRP00_01935 [Candidatus Aenigmarchaeota archaeon]